MIILGMSQPLRIPNPEFLQKLLLPFADLSPESRRPPVILARIADEGRDVCFELTEQTTHPSAPQTE